MARASYKGKYNPKHPEKYVGDPNNIIFRSLWERRIMIYLDNNTNVISWASEELAIPYVSPEDNRIHRYYPDFIVKARRNNQIVHMIWEVKPHYQTVEPKKKKRNTKHYITEVMTYAKNTAKWEAARKFCEDRGWEFQIITEKELKLNG